MKRRAKLSDLIEGIEFQSDERMSYLNQETGEVVSLSDEEFRAADEGAPIEAFPEWQRSNIRIAQEIRLGKKGYLALPSQFDLDEYHLMEEFCLSRSDAQLSDTLYAAIKGRGAFRRFKDTVHREGVSEEWYGYRDAAVRKFALGWCAEQGIDFEDSEGPGR